MRPGFNVKLLAKEQILFVKDSKYGTEGTEAMGDEATVSDRYIRLIKLD